MQTNSTTEFEIWKTIKLGIGPRTGEGLHRAILSAGFDRDAGNARLCLERKFVPHPREEEIDLVALEMHRVGYFPGGTRANDLTATTIELDGIYRWARHVGLDICPMEVGPQLRLAYLDQPCGEECFIAMEPLALTTQSADQIFVIWHNLGWNSATQKRDRVSKSLELTHATPFRYWSEDSCPRGCERPPWSTDAVQGGSTTTHRLMIFVKPRPDIRTPEERQREQEFAVALLKNAGVKGKRQ